MTTKTGHTPTPWRVTHQIYTDFCWDIVAGEKIGKVIATCGYSQKDSEYSENAKLIVRAVNSHEALLAIVKTYREHYINDRDIEHRKFVDETIKQAAGK